jgi:hypothetical protein
MVERSKPKLSIEKFRTSLYSNPCGFLQAKNTQHNKANIRKRIQQFCPQNRAETFLHNAMLC